MSTPLRLRAVPLPLAIAAGAALCGSFVMLMPTGDPVRAVAGLALVLVAPGAALLGALSPAKLLSAPERFAWQIGVSIAITILVTVALNALGVALNLRSWAITLTALTILACGVWAVRDRRATWQPLAWHPRMPGAGRLALLALAVLLCGGAVAVTIHSVRRTSAANHFTQLWILPSTSTSASAVIGVYNHEGSPQRYVLDVSRGGTDLLRLPAVSVPAHTNWTQHLTLPRGDGRLDVTLARAGRPAVIYRHVDLWLGTARSR